MAVQLASTIRSELEEVLPPILYRNHPRFRELTGLSPRSVSNEDSRGTGPAKRVYLGRLCGYPKRDLIDWLEQRARVVIGGDKNANS